MFCKWHAKVPYSQSLIRAPVLSLVWLLGQESMCPVVPNPFPFLAGLLQQWLLPGDGAGPGTATRDWQ